ncbi:unnamed protein product [Rotaria sp. Silwood2]|nr:unnamed protein product [Rotaria sp. Silwood2]CAF4295785.1 unnamed protein product [Rotaria sp. Silwood2]
MTTSNRCSKCSTSVGTCTCAGCKDYFCTKHFIAHRKELQVNLEHIIDTQNRLLKQFNENNHYSSLQSSLLTQIDQWQNLTIQKVNQTADNIRQEVTQMLNQQREESKVKVQVVVDELRKRKEEDDFVEDDLVRLKNHIDRLQQELEELQKNSFIELHIEQSEHIDWNHLAYLKYKSADIKKRKNLEFKSETSQGFEYNAQSTTTSKSKCNNCRDCRRSYSYASTYGGGTREPAYTSGTSVYFRRYGGTGGNPGTRCTCSCHKQM